MRSHITHHGYSCSSDTMDGLLFACFVSAVSPISSALDHDSSSLDLTPAGQADSGAVHYLLIGGQ